jgi:hypothetical protein
MLWGLAGQNPLIFSVCGLLDAAFAAGVIALYRREIHREPLPSREGVARVVRASLEESYAVR